MSSISVLEPTQLPIKWEPGALSLGVKRAGREADHSPPASAEAKNALVYTPTPPYVLVTQCLISEAQGQLYLFVIELLCSHID
jgi:hypothetical protein